MLRYVPPLGSETALVLIEIYVMQNGRNMTQACSWQPTAFCFPHVFL